MKRFQLGDEVRIAGLPNSQWQDRRGTIVNIVEDDTLLEGSIKQECEVDVRGERRWFMAEHLVKSVPERFVRLFRAEVVQRWHLDPDDTCNLKGDSQGLVALLCDRLSFSIRHAEPEVEAFYAALNERIAGSIHRGLSGDVALNGTRNSGAPAEPLKRANAA